MLENDLTSARELIERLRKDLTEANFRKQRVEDEYAAHRKTCEQEMQNLTLSQQQLQAKFNLLKASYEEQLSARMREIEAYKNGDALNKRQIQQLQSHVQMLMNQIEQMKAQKPSSPPPPPVVEVKPKPEPPKPKVAKPPPPSAPVPPMKPPPPVKKLGFSTTLNRLIKAAPKPVDLKAGGREDPLVVAKLTAASSASPNLPSGVGRPTGDELTTPRTVAAPRSFM